MTADPQRWLSEEDRKIIVAAVAALPPMTDEQIAGVCEVMISARERRRALARSAAQQQAQREATSARADRRRSRRSRGQRQRIDARRPATMGTQTVGSKSLRRRG